MYHYYCSLYEVDVEKSIQQCQALLDEPNLDTGVRTGDVYGVLIEHFAHSGNFEKVCTVQKRIYTLHLHMLFTFQAYGLMEELRQRVPTVNMSFYVEIQTIEAIHNSLGIPLGRGIGADMAGGRQQAKESDEESVDEDDDSY